MDETSPLFTIKDVRNAFEHIDDRLETIIFDGYTSVADWYIAKTTLLITPDNDLPPLLSHAGINLRTFVPTIGHLYFDRTLIDLFDLDLALRVLRQCAEDFKLVNMENDKIFYGGQKLGRVSEEGAASRWAWWRESRKTLGQPVGYSIGFRDTPPEQDQRR